jgi:hypothetical protein
VGQCKNHLCGYHMINPGLLKAGNMGNTDAASSLICLRREPDTHMSIIVEVPPGGKLKKLIRQNSMKFKQLQKNITYKYIDSQ